MECLKIQDSNHWNEIKELSTTKLVVIDVHKSWCGPCKVMEPTYKRLFTEIINPQDRLKFCTYADDLHIPELPENPSCRPLFILYKEKKIVGQVLGANAPSLETLINTNLPVINTEET